MAAVVRVQHDGGDVVLSAVGDVDADVPDLLDRPLRAVDWNMVQRVVIDLGGVTFLDSSGLRALVGVREVCWEKGRPLVLRAVPRQVEKMLSLTGLHATFVRDDVG